MGIFDFLKSNKNKAEGTTKAPSQVLRENGIDPSGLKFSFAADGTTTISGTAASADDIQRIKEIVADIPGVSAVNSQIQVAAVGAAPEADSEQVVSAGGGPQAEGAEAVREPASDGEQTYTVAAGDTLWKIAKDHYGDGGKYPKIFEANRDVLDDPDKIQVGQVLKIPAD